MIRRLVWSPESENDLLDIWHWGARHFSIEIADRHLLEIQEAAARLADFPETGRARDDLLAGIRSIVVYPTVVFYRVTRTAVQVVRVIDGRRNIAAILAGDE